MLAHGKGAAADLEPLVLFIDSLYCQIGENGYTGSSAAFALPTTERGHDRSSPLLSSDLEVLTACPVTSREPGSNPRFGCQHQVPVRMRIVFLVSRWNSLSVPTSRLFGQYLPTSTPQSTSGADFRLAGSFPKSRAPWRIRQPPQCSSGGITGNFRGAVSVPPVQAIPNMRPKALPGTRSRVWTEN